MLAIGATIFTACKKDDKKPLPNEMQIGTQIYPLNEAYANYWPSDDGLMDFCLYMSSADGMVEINFCNLHCTGTGPVIKSGTYTSADTYENMTVDKGDIGYTTDNYETNVCLGDNASLTVVNHGNDVYEFTWNTVDENGVAVKGHYKGKVLFDEAD